MHTNVAEGDDMWQRSIGRKDATWTECKAKPMEGNTGQREKAAKRRRETWESGAVRDGPLRQCLDVELCHGKDSQTRLQSLLALRSRLASSVRLSTAVGQEIVHCLQQMITREPRGPLTILAVCALDDVAEKSCDEAIAGKIAGFLLHFLGDRSPGGLASSSSGSTTKKGFISWGGNHGEKVGKDKSGSGDMEICPFSDMQIGQDSSSEEELASVKDVELQILSTLVSIGRQTPSVFTIDVLSSETARLLLSSSAGIRMRALQLFALAIESETTTHAGRIHGECLSTTTKDSLIPHNLLEFTDDPDPAVRQAALQMLHSAFRNPMLFSSANLGNDIYQRALARLQDDSEDVRLSAVQLIADYGAALCCQQDVSGSLTTLQQKTVDNAFVQICGAVADMAMKVRLEASSRLGCLVGASEKVMMQSLCKKIIGKDSKDEKDEENGSGTKVDEALPEYGDEIEVSKNGEGNMLLANISAGALIHALEDEFKEVRLAAISSIVKLGQQCLAFVKRARSFLLDMLSDEFQCIRVRAANALMEMTSSLDVKGDEIQGALTLVAEKNRESRQAGYCLLVASQFGCLSSIRTAVRTLLEGLPCNPQDEEEITSVLWSIGRNNPSLIECLSDELLVEANGILEGEGSIDDLGYVARLVLLVAASTSGNRNVMSLLPPHMLQHVQLLMPKLCHLPLNLDVQFLGCGVNTYIDASGSSKEMVGTTTTNPRMMWSAGRARQCAGGLANAPHVDTQYHEAANSSWRDNSMKGWHQNNEERWCHDRSGQKQSYPVPDHHGNDNVKREKASTYLDQHLHVVQNSSQKLDFSLTGDGPNRILQMDIARQLPSELPPKGLSEVLRTMQRIMDGLHLVKASVEAECFHMALRTLRDCRGELSAISQVGGEMNTMARFCALYIRGVAILVKCRHAILVMMGPYCQRHSCSRNVRGFSSARLPYQLVELTWEMEGRFQGGHSSPLRWAIYELRIAGYLLELLFCRLQRQSATDSLQQSSGQSERTEAGSGGNRESRMSETTLRKMVALVAWMMRGTVVPLDFTLLRNVKRHFEDIWRTSGARSLCTAQSLWKHYLDEISAQVAHSYWPGTLTCERSLHELWADLKPPSSSADHPIEFIKGLPLGLRIEGMFHNLQSERKLWLKLQVADQMPELRKISSAHLSHVSGESSRQQKLLNMTVQLRNMMEVNATSLRVSVLMEYTAQEIQEGRHVNNDWWEEAAHDDDSGNDWQKEATHDSGVKTRKMVVDSQANGSGNTEGHNTRMLFAGAHGLDPHEVFKVMIPLCKQQEVKLALAKDRGRVTNI